MRIERIDTEEIVGLTCPKTGNHILWDDEDIEDTLRGSVVSAIVTSLAPETCGFDWMPLAAAWKSHYQNVNVSNKSLDEVVKAFPVPGKALKIVSGGIACGLVYDVTYFVVPVEFPDRCFIRADFGDTAETDNAIT